MIIDEKMFLQLLIREQGLYSVYNGVRDALFYQLALKARNPIVYDELPNVLFEAKELVARQVNLIREEIPKPDAFRYYCCDFDNIRVYYFVNVDSKEETEHIACHLQTILPMNWSDHVGADGELETGYLSVIVLRENHPKRTNANYPMIIKHELVHVALEALIDDDLDLQRFYLDPANNRFTEFLCDIIPYLSNTTKKENGLNKYMDDAPLIFGYNAKETMGDYLTLMREMKDNQDSPFKNNAEKYAFFLIDMDGKSRAKYLGINMMMYRSQTCAKRWKERIEGGLNEGELAEERKEHAISVLNNLYEHMVK